MTAEHRLSRRAGTIPESATLAITRMAKELQAAGKDVLGFGAGEPDFATPKRICRAAREAMDRGETFYTPADGILPLKEALIERFAERTGRKVSPAQVVVAGGAKQALYNTIQVLCEEGDEVIIPQPYWVTYPEQVRAAGAQVVPVRGRPEDGFLWGMEELEAARTPATRMLVLCNPSNPTGAVFARDALEEIAAWAARHGIYVLADEVYGDLVYDGAEHISFAGLTRCDFDRVIVVDAVSKSYAMTGWRIGWAIGPAPILRAAARLQGHVTSNPCSVAQWAALEALRGDPEELQEMVRVFAHRRGRMLELLAEVPGVDCVEPCGAFYVFPRVADLYRFRGLEGSDAFCARLLEDVGIAFVPGSAFGEDEYVRISYACSAEDIEEGMRRLAAWAGSG